MGSFVHIKMVFTFLLMLIGMDFLWAQQADTLYIYETVIEYDTLINRDTLFVHDTVHLSQTPTEKSRKDYHQKQKSDRKQHEELLVSAKSFPVRTRMRRPKKKGLILA